MEENAVISPSIIKDIFIGKESNQKSLLQILIQHNEEMRAQVGREYAANKNVTGRPRPFRGLFFMPIFLGTKTSVNHCYTVGWAHEIRSFQAGLNADLCL